eukprot:1154157-Pelagomonas_calceolata.AAC.2
MPIKERPEAPGSRTYSKNYLDFRRCPKGGSRFVGIYCTELTWSFHMSLIAHWWSRKEGRKTAWAKETLLTSIKEEETRAQEPYIN